MRRIMTEQMQIGEVGIPDIEFDLQCRDEVPEVLQGLQEIYNDKETRRDIFQILKELIPENIRIDTGRWGMDLWKILVMGTLRLCCDWNHDHLHDQVNNHRTIRQMLGHGLLDFCYRYRLQTVKDNMALITPEIMDKINQVVVKAGHRMLGAADEPLKTRADSFVVETDVHFPTDINLLWDALRKMLILIVFLADLHGLIGWRKSGYWLSEIKQSLRRIQRMKRSTSKDDQKKEKQAQKIKDAHQAYIDMGQSLVDRVEASLSSLPDSASKEDIEKVKGYVQHARRQIDQIRRRVIQDETIPHGEKVFSIFEPHTRWISKGKAGVPQELGLPVCIVEDQYGFILDGLVMETGVDKDIAVSFIKSVKEKYPNLSRCSFDKGFHSPDNQKELGKILDVVILPKKGRLSAADRDRESSDDFVAGRRQHSAVESAINGLENAGLDRCPDHGLDGFKSYVGLSVLARNFQKLGKIIRQKEKKEQERLAA